ncbi:MAG: PTS mannose transporter subunit IIA [Candidatus Riflebacteria bacterium]|nr:PTS mannose transporter subunit IIA [Candidatus Riflebacteria bacterium]
MTGIVVISHGNLSLELLETVTLIMGEQKNASAVTFSPKESIETLREKALNEINKYIGSGGCLVLTDVLGGSATNICVDFIRMENVRVVSGVNLPMLMDAFQNREKLAVKELSQKVREGGAKGIIDLNDFFLERAKKRK